MRTLRDEWWLWGPMEWTQLMTEKEQNNDGEDACAQVMEEEERRYYDKLSQV